MSGQSHAPAALYPRGKDPRYPFVQEAGWAPVPVWTQRLQEKSFASAGDRNLVIQSVVRHFADWATPAPYMIRYFIMYIKAGNKCLQMTGMHTDTFFQLANEPFIYLFIYLVEFSTHENVCPCHLFFCGPQLWYDYPSLCYSLAIQSLL
jgi:hypothetical protein